MQPISPTSGVSKESRPDPNSVPEKKKKSARPRTLKNRADMTSFLGENEKPLVVELTKEFSEKLRTTSSIRTLHVLRSLIGRKVWKKMVTDDFLSIDRDRHRRLMEEVVLRCTKICKLVGKVLKQGDYFGVHHVKGSALSGFPRLNPSEPTSAQPGSEEKVQMLVARNAVGKPLWHEKDVTDGSQDPWKEKKLRGVIDAALQKGLGDGEQITFPSSDAIETRIATTRNERRALALQVQLAASRGE